MNTLEYYVYAVYVYIHPSLSISACLTPFRLLIRKIWQKKTEDKKKYKKYKKKKIIMKVAATLKLSTITLFK